MDQEQPDPLVVMYLFSALALRLNRQRPDIRHHKLSESNSRQFARFFRLLQDNYKAVRDAHWYGAQLGTTYKTLNLLCKQATGQTAKQLIDAFVVLELKRRLVLDDISSQQLAWEFGFDDASNFLKYFKKLSGQTPAEFQKAHRLPRL